MRKKLLLALIVAGFATLGAQPSMAKTAKISCSRINKALHSGKTQEQVAKSLKVSPEVVRGCTQKHAEK
jgi:hypothetical protein